MIGRTSYVQAQEGEEGLARASSTIAEALKNYDAPGAQICFEIRQNLYGISPSVWQTSPQAGQ